MVPTKLCLQSSRNDHQMPMGAVRVQIYSFSWHFIGLHYLCSSHNVVLHSMLLVFYEMRI